MSNIIREILSVLGLSDSLEETEIQLVKAQNKKGRINEKLRIAIDEYDNYRKLYMNHSIDLSTKKNNNLIEKIDYLRNEKNKLTEKIDYLCSKAVRLRGENVSQHQLYTPITNDNGIRTSTAIEYTDLVDVEQVTLRKRKI